MEKMYKKRAEDVVRKQWWLQQLCETDRIIFKRKREEVQKLIQDFMTEPVSDSSDSSFAVVPMQPQKSLHLDWDSYWPSIDHFYQQVSFMMGLTKDLKMPEEKAVVACQSKTSRFDIKTLRTVMEHELENLGISALKNMQCSKCMGFFSSERLYLTSSLFNPQSNSSRCGNCWKGKFPRRSVFHHLIKGIAVKWAKMVEKRVGFLYGKWDERLDSMVQMLKENVLLADDIANLLVRCSDPEEFKETCEVVIITTIVFYLEYVDFRRSCEALIKIKPSVPHCQLFEIFGIYFPNRAKGIKTGDFL